MKVQLTKFDMKLYEMFNPFWSMAIVNLICRSFYKAQKRIFENIMVDAMKEFFKNTRDRKIGCCLSRAV